MPAPSRGSSSAIPTSSNRCCRSWPPMGSRWRSARCMACAGCAGRTALPSQALGTGDFAIDPAYRGRHLFGRIMSAAAAEARERGCRYLVSLSAGPATRLQSLRAGWRDLGEITTLQRTSPAAQVRRLLHEKLAEHRALRALAARAQRQAWLRSAAGVRPVSDRFKPLERALGQTRSAAGLSLSVSERPRPEAMASLIARRPPHDMVRSACDAHYLAWRFDNPLSSYRFVYCGASTLEGFVVLETPDDPERDRVRIVLWEAQDEALKSRLLRTRRRGGAVRRPEVVGPGPDTAGGRGAAWNAVQSRRRRTARPVTTYRCWPWTLRPPSPALAFPTSASGGSG